MPFLVPAISPDALRPLRSQDTVAGSVDFPKSSIFAKPSMPKRWNARLFETLAADFPNKDVAKMAVQCVRGEFDPGFVGDRAKAVVPKLRAETAEEAALRRAKLEEERSLGHTVGPFAECPFPNDWDDSQPRFLDQFLIDKKKWIEDDMRKRVISHGSKFEPSSVNDLCFNPRLIDCHVQAWHIGQALVQAGQGCYVMCADIKSCFRRQWNPVQMLFAQVIRCPAADGTMQYWVDMANGFGMRWSEYGWSAIKAVIVWALRVRGIFIMCYVDNIFLILPRSVGCDEFRRQSNVTLKLMHDLGLPMHEHQTDHPFEGLGWVWSADGPEVTMAVPIEKMGIIKQLLREWAARCNRSFTVDELRKVVGLLLWVVNAFPIGRVHLAALVHVRTQGERVMARISKPATMVRVQMSERAADAIRFWQHHFSSCGDTMSVPVRQRFSPLVAPEIVGEVDASAVAAGGWIRGTGAAFVHVWTSDETQVLTAPEGGAASAPRMELRAVKVWFDCFAEQCEGRRVLLLTDSANAAALLRTGYSKHPDALADLHAVLRCCVLRNVDLRVETVCGDQFNTVAHALSHDQVDTARGRSGHDLIVQRP
jgi:hypothetical protein